eukprot:INCI8908.1.p1 GENE.INCI8908.1~~INCI8908.1.p1  ORF type:complete len:477 (+),score=103.92 INCI8908.1:120-1550(+)
MKFSLLSAAATGAAAAAAAVAADSAATVSAGSTAAAAAAAAVADDVADWDILRAGIDAWRALDFDANFSVVVGTDEGRLFLHTPDNFSMDSYMEAASLSKWGTAMILAGMVQDGTLRFTDQANKHLTWWAQDPKDPRYNVTIADLLSFTAGFEEDVGPVYDCGTITDYTECAQATYNQTTKYTYPRRGWAYNACQIQFAGAIAVAASGGKHIQELIQQYLYKPYNMTHTNYFPYNTPLMAVGINITGTDVEQFMQGMLGYKGASVGVMNVAEQDWTTGLHPEGDVWFGHYSLGHYWECLGWGTPKGTSGPVSPDCLQLNIQAGPGELGIYPLLDRSGGGGLAGPVRPAHYWALIIAEPDELSGIPEYLRILAKPVSDLILNGTDPVSVPQQTLLNNGGGILRRDIEYIESVLGACTCSAAANATGEPYATLLKSLPDDEPKVNRRDLLKQGKGLTLLDVVSVQKELGTCSCKGRKE